MPRIIARADRLTPRNFQKELYSDFTINFDLNPITGFLVKVSNEESVKQSIKNLVMTNRGERFFQSFIGSDINRSIFELNDEVTSDRIKTGIELTLKNCEPRATNVSVVINPNIANEEYLVTIFFGIINIPNKIFDLPITYRIR